MFVTRGNMHTAGLAKWWKRSLQFWPTPWIDIPHRHLAPLSRPHATVFCMHCALAAKRGSPHMHATRAHEAHEHPGPPRTQAQPHTKQLIMRPLACTNAPPHARAGHAPAGNDASPIWVGRLAASPARPLMRRSVYHKESVSYHAHDDGRETAALHSQRQRPGTALIPYGSPWQGI